MPKKCLKYKKPVAICGPVSPCEPYPIVVSIMNEIWGKFRNFVEICDF